LTAGSMLQREQDVRLEDSIVVKLLSLWEGFVAGRKI